MKLIVGNKNYSSWSMRAWLALALTGAPFEEELLALDTPEFYDRIQRLSPAGRVPVLIDGDTSVWDTLSIIEYLAETFPEAGLWPSERRARAHARSICAEFHSGFPDLRGHFPMNLRRTPAPHPRAPEAGRDIARIREIWTTCRGEAGDSGPFLFGPFSAADCFFAPVVTRFLTYQLDMGETVRAYADAVMTHPLMLDWRAEAAKETAIVEADEVE
ncbi:glutathione S-transferase family protein [Stappia sp. ES.058]|uniref:glutathione S-transferase family protein n=1 Tax=Stappia sp. ES.058 TaxID=1881061 RepID=UPI00087BCFD3|nr:glutathione S-transferase family protein [Stappia sp. ES.058]SDU20134.1 glutathione S-transferase [Stappia sp. ES.058]